MDNHLFNDPKSKDARVLSGNLGDEDAESSIPQKQPLTYPNYEDKASLSSENLLANPIENHHQPIENKKILRPISAFFYFVKERRTTLRIEKPDLAMTELSKEIGIEWKNLSDEDKQIYIRYADEDKIRYQRELDEHNRAKSNEDKKINN